MSANENELDAITLYRKSVLIRPKSEDLLTLADADEHKLSALDQLLKKMIELRMELDSVGLALKADNHDQYPRKNLYELVDMRYVSCGKFKIRIKSDWFILKWGASLHDGFNFQLCVAQNGFAKKNEMADWIDIRICHLDTTPIALASMREHAKNFNFLLKNPEDSFFYDLPMNCTRKVVFEKIDKRLTFKTVAFNETVEDACRIVAKIISRKEHLRISTRI